jgi:rhamnose transport system ATP-binding protein
LEPSNLLLASSLHKAFAGVQALDGLSFDLRSGEVHALVGENGAGKSTFVRIVTGAVAADAGSLVIGGEPVGPLTPAGAQARGIAAIHQQPALFPDLTVAENITLPTERGRPWSRVDWGGRARRAAALLDRIGASIDLDRRLDTLSLPEQQLVGIARAVGANARIVLMDEPTASLSDREVDALFSVVRRLRETGAGIVYISHRLEEIRRVADRVTVIRDGRTVAADLPADLDRDEMIRLMVGRPVDGAAPAGAAHTGDVVLEVRGLSSRAAGFRDIWLTIRRGEIVGLAGLVGSGRTELAETLFGLRGIDAGDVRVNGRDVAFRSPGDAIRCGIAYVPEDRLRHGVVTAMNVAENTSLASLGRVSRAGFVRRGAERDRAAEYVRRFKIRTPSVLTDVGALSGGNQQKVSVARWLAAEPSLLILDEPTQGVDVASKAEIHALIRELAARGLGILLISSELPEILAMAHRVVVMRRGTLSHALPAGGATQESILALALDRHPSSASSTGRV